MPEEIQTKPVNYGLCLDCDREVQLGQDGHCSVCTSSATMKRGVLKELAQMLGKRKEENEKADPVE